jgi:hypothetical protein
MVFRVEQFTITGSVSDLHSIEKRLQKGRLGPQYYKYSFNSIYSFEDDPLDFKSLGIMPNHFRFTIENTDRLRIHNNNKSLTGVVVTSDSNLFYIFQLLAFIYKDIKITYSVLLCSDRDWIGPFVYKMKDGIVKKADHYIIKTQS